MDWEKQLKSIVEETDANLANVKMTLGKGGTTSDWLPAKFSPLVGHVRKPIMGDLPSSSYTPFDGTSRWLSPLSPLTQSNSLTNTYNTKTVPSSGSLEDKLDHQSKAIEQLKRIVHRLESEKDQYRDHIQDLQRQVRQVSARLSESSMESASGRQVENWRREIMVELDDIRSQLRSCQTQGNGEFTESQMIQHSRELLELRRCIREDTDSMRKDVDVLRTRIAKLELNMSENESQREKIHKTQSMPGVSDIQIPREVPWYNGGKSLGKMELTELRTNVSCLKHKVDAMESFMRSSKSAGHRDKPYGDDLRRHREEPTSVDNLSDDGSSLDLADYDSAEFSLAHKPNPRKEPLVYDSEEELDINDLDLSDDKSELSDADILTIDDI